MMAGATACRYYGIVEQSTALSTAPKLLTSCQHPTDDNYTNKIHRMYTAEG